VWYLSPFLFSLDLFDYHFLNEIPKLLAKHRQIQYLRW
jgi:hypothetical protein